MFLNFQSDSNEIDSLIAIICAAMVRANGLLGMRVMTLLLKSAILFVHFLLEKSWKDDIISNTLMLASGTKK